MRERLSGWRLAAFASPAGPLLAYSLAPLIFLGPFFERAYGIPYETTYLALSSARILDVIIDPLLGLVQDNTKSRFGRRRIWLLAATPVMTILIGFAFFLVPHKAGFWLIAPLAFALYASFASMMISHLGWAGELAPDYHGRTRILGAVQVASVVGQMLMIGIPALMEAMRWGTPESRVQAMAAGLIATLPLTVLLAATATPEPAAPKQREAGIRATIEVLRTNPYVWRVLVPDFLIGIVQSVTATLFIFFAESWMGLGESSNRLLFVFLVAGLFGVPIWLFTSRRFGKHVGLQIAALYQSVLLAAVALLPHGAFTPAAIVFFACGLASSAGVFLVRAMMADVVDADRVKTGEQRSGLFFGLMLTTTKLGLAVGPLAALALKPAGFDPKLATANEPLALWTLLALFVGAPIVLSIVVAWLLKGFPLNEEKQRQLREAIESREAEARRSLSQDAQS